MLILFCFYCDKMKNFQITFDDFRDVFKLTFWNRVIFYVSCPDKLTNNVPSYFIWISSGSFPNLSPQYPLYGISFKKMLAFVIYCVSNSFIKKSYRCQNLANFNIGLCRSNFFPL